MSQGWWVTLNGFSLDGGGTAPVTGMSTVGCLTVPPDGMGVPPLRVEDQTFPQRDGTVMFADWYLNRVLTFDNVMVCPDNCSCTDVRTSARNLMLGWSRHCAETELVIYTDCHDPSPAVTGEARALIGPYGVVGRPRQAQLSWLRGRTKCAQALLRFDGVDHKLYVLNELGEPGSGGQCVELTPAVESTCMQFPVCFDDTCSDPVSGMAFTVDNSTPGSGPQETLNFGDLCAGLTITLTGPLTFPTLVNETTGQTLTYMGVIPAGSSVVIDTETGTAHENGVSRTHLLEGDLGMFVQPGENTIRMTSTGPSDTGTASVCYRPSVLSG